ncbi:hypothetical protein D3C80_1132620 [compost metagenome]
MSPDLSSKPMSSSTSPSPKLSAPRTAAPRAGRVKTRKSPGCKASSGFGRNSPNVNFFWESSSVLNHSRRCAPSLPSSNRVSTPVKRNSVAPLPARSSSTEPSLVTCPGAFTKKIVIVMIGPTRPSTKPKRLIWARWIPCVFEVS